jgi:response regulator RpfG family c-di-GMP phosphodiesterase
MFENTDQTSLGSRHYETVILNMAYIPVPISVLKKLKTINSSLYISLSAEKFVRILREGANLSEVDLDKYSTKGIHHLYVDNWKDGQFLSHYRTAILTEAARGEISLEEYDARLMFNVEMLREFGNTLKAGDDLIEITKGNVESAIKIFEKERSFQQMIERFNAMESLRYSAHCILLIHASCFLANKLGTLIKKKHIETLTLASMIHDITLNDSLYDFKTRFFHSDRVTGPIKENPEEHAIFRHPLNASELSKSFGMCQPELETIIIQHHEKADGTGFPNGTTSQKIHPLSALFIVAEDFVSHFIRTYPNPDWPAYLESRTPLFQSPPFREPFSVLRVNL